MNYHNLRLGASLAAMSKCIKLLLVIPAFLFLWKPHVRVLLLPRPYASMTNLVPSFEVIST